MKFVLERMCSGLDQIEAGGRAVLATALILLATLTAAAAVAQVAQPVRLIVPFANGGGTDVVARILAPYLAESTKRSVIVENKPGAGGAIATAFVAHASPDGMTILVGSSSTMGSSPALMSTLPYDVLKDFVAVGKIHSSENVLVIHPSVPVNDLRAFIAYAKANPGQVSYGSSGLGSTYHLGTELFALRAGIALTHVPYKGAGPAAQDLLAGHIQMMMETLYNALPSIRAGRLKALGIASASRNPSLPDVRTFSEQGLSNCEFSNWTGLFLPARASNALIGELNAGLNKVLLYPDVKERFLKLGLQPAPGTPEDLAATVRTDIARWRETVRLARIKAE
jgi:tripartite-type tricarboxylate transporter receptor subunit TctC